MPDALALDRVYKSSPSPRRVVVLQKIINHKDIERENGSLQCNNHKRKKRLVKAAHRQTRGIVPRFNGTACSERHPQTMRENSKRNRQKGKEDAIEGDVFFGGRSCWSINTDCNDRNEC